MKVIEKTLEEVINTVLMNMKPSEKVKMKITKKEDLILYHHGFGTKIRNTFRLWSGNPELLKDMGCSMKTHPDSVSMKIIEAIWNKLQ